MGKMIHRTVLLGLSVCLLAGVARVGFAQNTNSADLRGTVTDSSGAVVPGVTVTVHDVDKNVTNTYTTNDRGLYDTGSIVADHYIVTFTKAGFTTYVRGPVTLQVGTSSVDAVLTVGATSQRVVVTANIPLLRTETGEQSTTLTSENMHQLPQVGANWQNFVTLLPGATGNPAVGTTSTLLGGTPGQVASVNGNLPYNTMLQDGANTTHPISQNAKTAVFETVAEVQVSTSAFSAQNGVGGILFNQITKGGGSQFHGSGYEYFQNDALNAAPYAFGAKGKVPVLRYNNFGFTVGGPIIKKRMFFFFNYDKVLNFGGSANHFVTIPTAAMQSGDFTGFPTIYDPTTQTITQGPNGPVVQRTSFEDEYHNGNKIPANMIDPVAAKIQSYYPAPNMAGTIKNGLETNNYFYNTPSSVPLTNFFGRLDFDITPTNRFTASESESDNPGSAAAQGLCPANCLNYDANFNDAQVSDIWMISPTTTNEARFGLDQGFTIYSPAALDGGYPTKLGWNFSKADNFPTIGIDQVLGLGAGVVHAVNVQYGYDPSDVVTLIRGRHVLHFGGEFLMNEGNSTAWGNVNAGTMTYGPVYTSATGVSVTPSGVTGVGYADFLLGQTQAWSAAVTRESGARLKLPQAFIQDDIKVRPNLTLNVGLRWQGMTGWTEVNGNMQSFDPTVMNPATQTLGAMWYGATHANDRKRLQAPTWNNFLPRIGFSWQPRPNLVVRGGYGLYGYTFSLDRYGAGMGGVFGSSGNSSDETNGLCPVVQLASDGSAPDTTDLGCGIPGRNDNSINSLYLDTPTDPAARNGQSVTYNNYHAPTPKIHQYNLEIQRELGANMVVNLAYVGSNAYDLAFPVDINQIPEEKLGPNDSPTSRPYPQYRAISGSTDNAISNYNSMQASIQKRMSSGLEFNFNYVWSHFLSEQDTSAWGTYGGAVFYQNAYAPSANYGPSNFDIRNAFKGNVIYDLPMGRGRLFLNNNSILDLLLGGWQSAGTIIVQSGNPFNVVMNTNNSFNQTPYQYPNVVGDPNSGPHTINEWFNIAAFAQPAPGTYGNSTRNSLVGPKFQQINFSLGKSFHLEELAHHRIDMQIRADATNVFNHPSFQAPNAAIGSALAGQIRGVSVGGRAMQLYGRINF